ncbi:ParB/RepB/Spo0J family partition protein [Nocardia brasiliensis]|uniref:ParB/RepB/Spo0J family partition protein n=1 Tax=Nocardia brasiliensis TaxID=37326 RepID=UPI002457CFFD|nr:ParB N-terminal domain-containing protein [Nocardia brasiliensis]
MTTIDTTAGTDPHADTERPSQDTADPKVEAGFKSPDELVVADNVRENFDLSDHADDAASIREHGVRIPIKVDRMPDGSLRVRDGQIRTLIAAKLEVKKVPVWITEAVDPGTPEAEIDRITEQITVNDRRTPLTAGDRAAGITRMLDLGASVTRICRALQTDRDQVKAASKVGKSRTARRSVDDHQLDFEQAAILADYDVVGDSEAVQRLLDTPRSMFVYEARRIANQREELRARLRKSLPYAAAGFAILTEHPEINGSATNFVAAQRLFTADDQPVSLAQIHAEPGRWFVYCHPLDDVEVIDRQTGEVIDYDTVDWRTERSPDTSPSQGRRHAREVEQRPLWDAIYYLPTDQLDTVGLHEAVDVPDPEEDGAQIADTPHSDPAADAGGVADPQEQQRAQAAAQARAQAQARAAEERRCREQAEHRATELDKQGQAAMEARRDFLRKLVSRNSEPPKQAAMFMLETAIHEPGLLDNHDAMVLALELLGVTGWRPELLTSITNARPPRCRVVHLALVLAACELNAGKKSWRYNDIRVQRYLHFLASVGHTLTPVEQAAAGDIDPDTIQV